MPIEMPFFECFFYPPMNYLDALQIFCVVLAIIAVGYLCGGIKMYTYRDCSAIRRLMYLVCIPGLIFYLIGNANLASCWQPVVNAVLTQFVVHILIIACCFVANPKSKAQLYVRLFTGMGSPDFIFVGYPILQVLFRKDLTPLCVLCACVQSVLIEPLIVMLAMKAFDRKDIVDAGSEDPAKELEAIDQASSNTPANVEGMKDGLLDDHAEPITDAVETEDKTKKEPEPEPETVKEKPMWQRILFLYVNPITIALLLGIIWTCTPWDMLKFMDAFVYDLGKSVVASGLFAYGVFMWEHPFFHGPIVETTIGCLAHFVLVPLISCAWSYILPVDREMARALVMIHATPVSFSALNIAENCGLHKKGPTYIFFWTNLLWVAAAMIWVVVFNETRLLA